MYRYVANVHWALKTSVIFYATLIKIYFNIFDFYLNIQFAYTRKLQEVLIRARNLDMESIEYRLIMHG